MKKKRPNLQWVTVLLDATSPKKIHPFRGKRVLACTKCIKAMAKRK